MTIMTKNDNNNKDDKNFENDKDDKNNKAIDNNINMKTLRVIYLSYVMADQS